MEDVNKSAPISLDLTSARVNLDTLYNKTKSVVLVSVLGISSGSC